MSTLTSVIPFAFVAFALTGVLAYLLIKNLIVAPQEEVEAHFVEYLREQKKDELEKELKEFLRDDVIDNREWAIMSTHLLGYSQQWSKRASDRRGPAREIIKRLADDAVSDTHYLSKKIISRVFG